MKQFTRAVILLITAVTLFAGLTSCSIDPPYAYSDSDTYVCVYDGSDKNGHKLKGEPLQPNEEGREIDDNDRPIRIPASDRFWLNVIDDAKRDPGALPYFEEYALGAAIPVRSQVKTEFKVNPDNPCEFYDKRLRRNVQDKEESENEYALGYDARVGGEGYPDAAAVASTPWFTFLRETLEVAVQKAYKREVRKYPWQKVVFDYPINANEDGVVPDGEEPGESTQDVLARDVGREAQKIVTEKMGADYLCGITSASECQPFTVTIIDATLPDEFKSLLAGRSEVEQLREDAKNADARLAALRDLDAKNQESKDLEERINAAELKAKQAEADLALAQARIDKAQCIVFAEYGLDCEGHFPPASAGVDVNVAPQGTPGG